VVAAKPSAYSRAMSLFPPVWISKKVFGFIASQVEGFTTHARNNKTFLKSICWFYVCGATRLEDDAVAIVMIVVLVCGGVATFNFFCLGTGCNTGDGLATQMGSLVGPVFDIWGVFLRDVEGFGAPAVVHVATSPHLAATVHAGGMGRGARQGRLLRIYVNARRKSRGRKKP